MLNSQNFGDNSIEFYTDCLVDLTLTKKYEVKLCVWGKIEIGILRNYNVYLETYKIESVSYKNKQILIPEEVKDYLENCWKNTPEKIIEIVRLELISFLESLFPKKSTLKNTYE